jgi:predicted ArsR family transcriptional regulator
MPLKYHISDKSIEVRNLILQACKGELKTVLQVARIMDMGKYKLSFHIEKLVESGHLKADKIRNEYNHEISAYLTIKDVYVPEEVLKAEAEFISPFGRVIRFEGGSDDAKEMAAKLVMRDRRAMAERRSPRVHIGGTSSMLAHYAHD